MNEQGRHENSICPRQKVVKPTCCAHWVWQDEVAKIVDVSRKAPPSRAQKDTIMLYPITCSVFYSNNFSWRTPQLAVAVRTTHEVFLMIDGSKQNVATDSSCQNCQGQGVWEDDRVSSKVLCLESIHPRKPDNGSPCQVKSKVIMTDVDSAKIPIFVDEEVYDVNGVKGCADKNWFGDEAMQLVLVCNKGKVAGPELAEYSNKNHCVEKHFAKARDVKAQNRSLTSVSKQWFQVSRWWRAWNRNISQISGWVRHPCKDRTVLILLLSAFAQRCPAWKHTNHSPLNFRSPLWVGLRWALAYATPVRRKPKTLAVTRRPSQFLARIAGLIWPEIENPKKSKWVTHQASRPLVR